MLAQLCGGVADVLERLLHVMRNGVKTRGQIRQNVSDEKTRKVQVLACRVLDVFADRMRHEQVY